MNDIIQMIPVPDSLASIVQYLMTVEIHNPTVQNILPIGHPVLLIFPGTSDSFQLYLQPTCKHLGITKQPERAILVGQLTRSVPVSPEVGMKIIGVHFYPTFFGRSQIAPIIDTFVNLSDLLSNDLMSLFDECMQNTPHHSIELLFQFLYQWLAPVFKEHPPILPFENLLKQWVNMHGIVDIENSAIHHGYSVRSLQRLMKSQTGYTPKQYNRLLRQHFILELAGNPNQTLKLAAEKANYFDHSHFIKDFKSLTGVTPKEFMQSAILSRALSCSKQAHPKMTPAKSNSENQVASIEQSGSK